MSTEGKKRKGLHLADFTGTKTSERPSLHVSPQEGRHSFKGEEETHIFSRGSSDVGRKEGKRWPSLNSPKGESRGGSLTRERRYAGYTNYFRGGGGGGEIHPQK